MWYVKQYKVTIFQVTEFLYFCSKATWAKGTMSVVNNDAESLLMDVLTEESVSITQTFVARLVKLYKWYVN